MNRIVVFLLLMIVCINSWITAQESPESPLLDVIRAYFRSDNLTPLVGEPLVIDVIVEIPPDATLADFPEFGEIWGDFVILQTGDIEEVVIENDWTRYRQSLSVLLWESGDFEPPETLVSYRLLNGEDIYFVPFNTLFFTVPSVLNPDMNQNELRPFKPQIGYFNIPFFLIVIIVVALVGSGYWLWRFWQKRREKNEIHIIPASPAEVAITQLKQLESKQSMPVVWSDIATISRTFIAQKFNLLINSLTTDELVQILRQRQLFANTHVDELERILKRADREKFESDVGDSADSTQRVQFAINWVLNVDDYMGDIAELNTI